jgi:hypothetical protein
MTDRTQGTYGVYPLGAEKPIGHVIAESEAIAHPSMGTKNQQGGGSAMINRPNHTKPCQGCIDRDAQIQELNARVEDFLRRLNGRGLEQKRRREQYRKKVGGSTVDLQ